MLIEFMAVSSTTSSSEYHLLSVAVCTAKSLAPIRHSADIEFAAADGVKQFLHHLI